MSMPSPDHSWPPDSAPDGAVDVDSGGSAGHVVRLSGEIDDELRLDLDDAVTTVTARRAGDPRPVHVDATAVTFMDSTGAAFLAKLAVSVRPDRVTIHPSDPVAFLLDVTRLSEVLDTAEDTAEDTPEGPSAADA